MDGWGVNDELWADFSGATKFITFAAYEALKIENEKLRRDIEMWRESV